MNPVLGLSARLLAYETPPRVLVHTDSRTLVMELMHLTPGKCIPRHFFCILGLFGSEWALASECVSSLLEPVRIFARVVFGCWSVL